MVSLAPPQPQNTTLNALESVPNTPEYRPYLGVSVLGHPCRRFLWYSFRWCFEISFPARIRRLFDRGHREEPYMIEQLAKIGIIVYGDQEEAVCAFGHCKGHNDGKAIGVIEAPKTLHLSEFKTMGDKYFKEVVKKGVKEAKPIYFYQCQGYMHLMGLSRTLFLAVNKNDDAYYVERLYYDREVGKELIKKAESIVLADRPPRKAFSPTWYECKFCDARFICHSNHPVSKNCRTCTYCDIEQEGRWSCRRKTLYLATQQQRMACADYALLDLV